MSDNHTTKKIIVLKGLEGHQPTHLSGAQPFLLEHLPLLVAFWWFVLVVTVAMVAVTVWRIHESN